VDLNQLNSVFFVGIGGIGMSALARYFKHLGLEVQGYDRTETKLTQQLEKEGISVHFEDKIELIASDFSDKENTLVVFTPAIPKEHSQLNYFITNGFKVMKRAEVLGLITQSRKTIAVAGTHGKTTVSTMISHLLHHSHIGCDAFVGGIAKNYNSNLILSEKSDYVVVEADEFDRSFLKLFPFFAVITATDADHLDIYSSKEQMLESFKEFSKQIHENGVLFVRKQIYPNFIDTSAKMLFTYSLKTTADFYAKNIQQNGDTYLFDLKTPIGEFKNFTLGMSGLVNLENAVAALSVCLTTGAKVDDLRKALADFKGINRRFDYRIKSEKLIFIDDYAHHPEELKAVINSVKDIYKTRKITGVFQPHLFTRTRDFADDFAKSLDLLDEVILLDIYPARELPIEGITSEIIFGKIKNTNKTLCKKEELIDVLKQKKIDILLTLGAGDIDKLLEPIELMFNV